VLISSSRDQRPRLPDIKDLEKMMHILHYSCLPRLLCLPHFLTSSRSSAGLLECW